MRLFNAIDAKSAACITRRAKHGICSFVVLAYVVAAGSVAHAQSEAAPSVSLEAPTIDALAQEPHAVAASDAPRASEGALGRLDETRAWAARDDAEGRAHATPTQSVAGTDEIAASAEGALPLKVVEAGSLEDVRETGKALAGCASDRWAFRRLVQPFLRVPFAHAEHVSSLVVAVRSPRGPPIHG